MKQTLFTETNIKLAVILLCLVFLAQSITDAFNKQPMADECNPMEDSYCLIDAETWTVEEDPELHTCVHGDGEIYRWVHWRCNDQWQAQDVPDLQETDRIERMKEMLRAYDKEYLFETFYWWGKMFWVYPELAICIAKADTTLWRHTKSANNLGNVGNNDRGNTVAFDSEHKAVKAIYQTLNNQYLGNYQYVADLSRKFNKDGKVYATSEQNRHNNVMNCMSVIRWETVSDYFAFRF